MKKKIWSKAMALLMTICMVLSISPLTAFAAEDENPASSSGTETSGNSEVLYTNGFAEDGSYQPAVQAEDGVYEISNAGQLYWFARLVNGYYNSASDCEVGQNTANARLMNDITVNTEINDSARKWMPICSESLRYQGTFDGNGHSISGLYFPGTDTYNDTEANHYAAALVVYTRTDGTVGSDGSRDGAYGDTFVGLFGFVGDNGVVKNLTVKHSSFLRGSMDIGVIAGTNIGTIQNCTSEDNTVLGKNSVGGIVGSNNSWSDKNNAALLQNCTNNSHVTAISQGGGITGENYIDGAVENCTNNGTIDGDSGIGGITGVSSGDITGCTNSGNITSSGAYAAGISATLDRQAKLSDCINTGNISASGLGAGGITGYMEGTSSVENSSNSGDVIARTYSGGIAGLMSYSGTGTNINNCFNTGTVTTPTDRYYAGGIVGQNGNSKSTTNGGSIKNSWSRGKVTAPGKFSDYAGGIYGNLYGAGMVQNCYYLDSSAAKAGAVTQGTVTEPDNMTPAQSTDVFASGKIAWYLNHKGGNTETVWYQNVDNDKDHDAYPILDNKSAVVYACGMADENLTVAYTNLADADHEAHSMKWSYIAEQHWQVCDRCGIETAKAEHAFGEWTVTRTATSTVPGIEQRSCTDCGFTEQRDIYTDKSEDKLPDSAKGDVIKSVKVENGAPATTMNTSKSDLMNNILTDEEKDKVTTGGKNAHIWLTVKSLTDSAVPAEDKSVMETKATEVVGANAEITYLDISLFKQMTGTAEEQIHKTDAPISISVTIPEEIRTAANGMRRTFYVLRSHTEKGQTNCTWINGTYDSTTGAFTFATDRFSTYALVYKDTTISSGGHSSSGSSAATTYPVNVKSATNGTVKADKSTAKKGDTVTITVTPDKDCEIDKLTVTDKDGKTISATAKGNGQYTFTMPASSITITASFKGTDWNRGYGDCPKDSTCPIYPFTDAKTTDWYHDGVHFCLENKLMVGYGNNIFKPNDGTSRAMLAVMLWRLNGSPVVNYAMNFDDVRTDAWYTEAIRWATSEGVAQGYGNGKFGPDDTMTREQMVTILYRYAQYKGYDVSVGEDTNILSYSDAFTITQYAIPAMQWACGSGMVQGSNNALLPKGSTTRAQMATMMMRFCAEIKK